MFSINRIHFYYRHGDVSWNGDWSGLNNDTKWTDKLLELLELSQWFTQTDLKT